MRLFLSIDLPSALTEAVEKTQAELEDAAGLNFVDPAQAHVTLKFLGDTDPDQLSELKEAVGNAVENTDVDPFDATVEGLGAFPSTDYISVVWAGVEEGGTEMTTLHEALEEKTTEIGFDPEDHDFTPHITIARMNDGRGKELVQQKINEEGPELGSFRVGEVRLKESTLTEEGPEYETIARFPL